MSNNITTINDKGRKRPYVKPDSEVIEINVAGCINEAHVSNVNINGFDKGEVPSITIDEDEDDEGEANAKAFYDVGYNPWNDDDPSN